MKIKQVAKLLQKADRTVNQYIKDGLLKAEVIKISDKKREYNISMEAIEEFKKNYSNIADNRKRQEPVVIVEDKEQNTETSLMAITKPEDLRMMMEGLFYKQQQVKVEESSSYQLGLITERLNNMLVMLIEKDKMIDNLNKQLQIKEENTAKMAEQNKELEKTIEELKETLKKQKERNLWKRITNA